jgi:hypothetical protein
MKPQLTLGQLIALLEKQQQDLVVYYGLGYMCPGIPDSYRGYYNQLAFGIQDETQPTVAEVLAWARNAVGKTYEGYKGGTYTMTTDTKLWAAKYGESGGTMLVGVKHKGHYVLLKTRVED